MKEKMESMESSRKRNERSLASFVIEPTVGCMPLVAKSFLAMKCVELTREAEVLTEENEGLEDKVRSLEYDLDALRMDVAILGGKWSDSENRYNQAMELVERLREEPDAIRHGADKCVAPPGWNG